MELSKGAQEALTQAQILRLETGGNTIQTEHLFYGLLLLACYLDEPLDDEAYREEAKELRAFLEGHVRSVSSAAAQLRRDAKEDASLFADARPILGRAAEMVGNRPIHALELAKAVMEKPSPTVRALCGLSIPAEAKKDEKYARGVQAPDISRSLEDSLVEEKKRLEEEEKKRKEEENRKQEEERKRREQEEKRKEEERRRLAEERKRLEEQKKQEQEKNQGGGLNLDDLRKIIEAADRVNGNKPPVQNNRRKRTKIGWVTFVGGPAAALIQYFLIGLIIPAGVLFAAEHFLSWVSLPPTPWISFAVKAFALLWLFYLARGVAVAFGLGSKAFGLFLRLLSDISLVGGLMFAAKQAFFLTEIPQWMKIVGGVLVILILSAGAVLYEHLNYTAQQKKRTIQYLTSKGTPGKVLFQNLTRYLLLPSAVAIGLWAFPREMQPWEEKTVWIMGFLYAWAMVNMILSCVSMGMMAPPYKRAGWRFFRFLSVLFSLMIVPCLVLFLHWLFHWSPIQLWVIIVLGIYTLLALLMSILTAAGQAKVL